jgi:hypothetical protein
MSRCGYLLAIVVTGCTADAVVPAPPSVYTDASGEYAAGVSGRVTSRLGNVEVAGTLSMALTQLQDALTGRYQLQITLSDGGLPISFRHEGDVTGSLGEGSRPTVHLRIENDECPQYFMTFEGHYDPDLRQITLTGAVDAINTINGLCHLATRMVATLQLWNVRESRIGPLPPRGLLPLRTGS